MIDLANIHRSTDPRRIDLEGPVLVSHQAEFMPWLGFISKAAMGDVYLILDDTQFKKKYFENRNKIRFPNPEQWSWLNIPVKNKDSLPNMMDVKIKDHKFVDYHLQTIKTSYGKSPYFENIYSELKTIYHGYNSDKLVDFNVRLIKYAFSKFLINVPVLRVSDLKKDGCVIAGAGTDLVLSLVEAVNAKILVAGPSGKAYLDVRRFKNRNIGLVFQEFKHPIYKQIHGDFLQYMSFIDLLFNYGDEAVNILPKSNYTY